MIGCTIKVERNGEVDGLKVVKNILSFSLFYQVGNRVYSSSRKSPGSIDICGRGLLGSLTSAASSLGLWLLYLLGNFTYANWF